MIYREPVLGIHDLAPPEGRVTVELLDERGLKVVKRERADNAVMNHWNEAQKKVVRGDPAFGLGYNFHGNTVLLNTDTDNRWGNNHVLTGTPGGNNWFVSMQQGQALWNHPAYLNHTYHSILLSDSTEAVDADEWAFPGNITAFCYMPEAYAPAANTKRAGLLPVNSFRNPTTLRYQAEWGTTFGNGTINSVGIGNCFFPTSAGACFAQLSPYTNNSYGSDASQGGTRFGQFNTQSYQGYFGVNPYYGADIPICSGHRVSDAENWVLVSSSAAANQLTKMDFTTVTVRPFLSSGPFNATTGIALAGPTMTTIGAGTNRCAVTAIGADLWLAYTGTLKRCVKPTSTSLTVTNTYTPATIETCVDITTDGTDIYWLGATRVYKINPADGTITSSWLHGLSGVMYNIVWMGAPASKPRLFITYVPTAFNYVWNQASAITHSPLLTSAFTTAGVGEASIGFNPTQASANILYTHNMGLVMPMSNDCKHSLAVMGFSQSNSAFYIPTVHGPSHLSRTVLGSPIVKTGSNALRCTYEFGFS